MRSAEIRYFRNTVRWLAGCTLFACTGLQGIAAGGAPLVPWGVQDQGSAPIQANSSSDSLAAAGRLLGELWERTGPEIEASRRLIETSLAGNAGDGALVHAAALNHARHFRYRDAARLLKTQAPRTTRLDSWLLRSWCELATGQHDACLASLRDARRLALNENTPPDQRDQFFRHSGRIFGFLQGPALGHANADLLRDIIARVADGASPDELQAMNAESRAVLDSYDALSRDQAAATAQFLQDAAARGAAETQRIENSNQQLDSRRTQVQPELERLRMEANVQVSTIDQQAAPLLAQAAALDSSINQQAWSLNGIRNEIVYLQQLLAGEQDPVVRFPLVARLNQLYSIARQVEYDLWSSRSRLSSIQSQLNVLGVQRTQVAQTYSASIESGRSELEQINSEQRRNDRRLEQIAEGPRQVTGRALALENQRGLLSTYYVIPLEALRHRLQDELAVAK